MTPEERRRAQNAASARKRRTERGEEYLAYQREYNRRYRRSEQGRANTLRWSQDDTRRNPEKNRARDTLENALRRGALIRPDACERCGEAPPPEFGGRSAIHAHHHDYSKPLEVEWLCRGCHDQDHRECVG